MTLVNHSCVNRIGFIQEQTETPVEAPFRSQHERNAMCYLMARRDGGVSTVELMDALAVTTAIFDKLLAPFETEWHSVDMIEMAL